MSYRDPDGWLLPRRAPRHAAPLGFSVALQRHAHRALRLFPVAGMWGAGLCLVIGGIVLAVSAASPGHAAPTQLAATAHRASAAALFPDQHGSTATAGSQPESGQIPTAGGGTSAAGGAPTGAASAYRLVVSFAGRGNLTTPHFKVSAGRTWELQWSYSCRAGQPEGRLVVADASGQPVGQPSVAASFDQLGFGGNGSTWLSPNGATHYLVVTSNCDWTMKVMQPR